MNVTIIIPTYNKLERIKLTLESLRKQLDITGKNEVIIINDGSSDYIDYSLKKIKETLNFRYYKSDNKGRAYARNLGIEYANYETLLFIDDDVLLTPDFLFQHAMSQRSEPKVLHGEIKNFVYSYPFEDPINGTLFKQERHTMYKNEYFLHIREKCKILRDISDYRKIYNECKYMRLENRIIEVYDNNIKEWEWISFTGGNVSCPKKWIEEVNGFDENFGTYWGCEDLELGYRLKKQNKPFGYNKKASCCHIDHIRRDAKEQHKITEDYFLKKHRDSQILELNNYLFKRRVY